MKFYSTNNVQLKVDLKQAVTQGLAPDNGLYMPEEIKPLPAEFFEELPDLSFQEMSYRVASHLLGDDVPADELRRIVEHTIQFDAPLVKIEDHIFALELFHGPTMAFKDFGARFMSQLLGYYARQQDREIVILVATSGDTGSAVANGFLGVEGTKVIVLYPSGKVSEIQEKQFTTLGKNVTALEISGTFDDCQGMVKKAFLDEALRSRYFLTSANSINIARLIPQSFYYFYAYGKVARKNRPVVFAVPSGNFGNLTGGLLAKRMGLRLETFVAATNTNDIVPTYLKSAVFHPKPSQQTISNAMDVGNPSNFVRMLDLFNRDFSKVSALIRGYSFNDEETRAAMRHVHATSQYVLDPHGAVGYLGLKKYLSTDEQNSIGIFLETAHPAKFKDVVDETLGGTVEIPPTLQKFMKHEKQSVQMKASFEELKNYLIKTL
jgi:threonine synthase